MQNIERNGGKSTIVLKKVGNDCLYLYLFCVKYLCSLKSISF